MNSVNTPSPESGGTPPGAAKAPARVMVVDDHPIVRSGLAQLIDSQPDMQVCAQAADAAEAMGALPRARPDLLMTDFSMPGRAGVEFIKDVWAFDPQLKILVLTMREEEHYAERALRAGASGFIMKNAGSDAILGAIRLVLAGGVFLSPSQSGRMLRGLAGPAPRNHKSIVGRLSDREFEIFRLLGEGRDAREVAELLRLSRKTVDVHRANIKRKLAITSSTALIRTAVQWLENESRHSN